MMYTVYQDSLLLEEFVVSLYTLELIRICVCCTATHKRIILGAVLETFLFAGLLVLGQLTDGRINGAVISVWFFFSALLVGISSFGWMAVRRPFGVFGGYVLCKLMLGGILTGLLQWISRFSKKSGGWEEYISAPLILCGAGAVTTIFLALFMKRRKESLIAEVTVIHNREKLSCKGFLDSGNRLCEPISGAPVCVMRKELLETLLLPKDREHFRVIPFSSIGKTGGILEAFRIERLVIKTNLNSYIYEGVWVAICSRAEWKNDAYQIIIHGDFINR